MQEQYRIMLIEDSRTQAERVRALLEKEGWEVICAASSEAALDELNRARPDLILVDYYLPGMNGAEFCREIRMNVNTRGIPVMMLTVEGTGDAERRGLESGADDYLAKSVDPDVLLLRIRALLRKSQGQAAVVAGVESSFGRARLLAIDDSPTYLHYLVQELSAEHYVVERATGGRQGLERILKEPFDCVLVDLEMPDVDGIEVCRRVVAMRQGSEAPIGLVVLTAHEDKDQMTRGLEAGADDFIGKSADIAVVKSRIRALLRRKFFTEENRRILEELKEKELETIRERMEKEAAEARATMADKLAQTNLELEQTNRKLKEALDVTRAITEHAAEALFLLDPQGRVTFMNPGAERMFGYTQQELLGRVLHDALHYRPGGEPAPYSECPIGRSLLTGSTMTGFEDQFVRKDSALVEVSCSNAPIIQDGAVAAAVLVVHDISERKRSEERLRHSQKLESIGLLAGGIAHDFNNILTSIIGTASLIEEEPLPAGAAEMVRTIMTGAEKAADLTRQLLAYAGKGQFVSRQIKLPDLVREMAALIRMSVPKSVDIRFELEDAPAIPADPGQMQQVLMNLVINAGEAVGAGNAGLVAITTGIEDVPASFIDAAGAEVVQGRYVFLQVADTGCGMDENTKAKVFEPFFSTKFTGRGLGLAAVSGVMRSKKGAITISGATGAGTTFRTLFPVTKGAGPGGSARQSAEARPMILVADDDAAVRDFLRGALDRGGFAVVGAPNGKEALTLWREQQHRICLVLIDLVTPLKAGEELLAGIKAVAPEAKVLLTTADAESEARHLCSTYPGTAFIQKPFSSQSLIQKVRSLIGAAKP
jgi:PAS domain S-box-containing protein